MLGWRSPAMMEASCTGMMAPSGSAQAVHSAHATDDAANDDASNSRLGKQSLPHLIKLNQFRVGEREDAPRHLDAVSICQHATAVAAASKRDDLHRHGRLVPRCKVYTAVGPLPDGLLDFQV